MTNTTTTNDLDTIEVQIFTDKTIMEIFEYCKTFDIAISNGAKEAVIGKNDFYFFIENKTLRVNYNQDPKRNVVSVSQFLQKIAEYKTYEALRKVEPTFTDKIMEALLNDRIATKDGRLVKVPDGRYLAQWNNHVLVIFKDGRGTLVNTQHKSFPMVDVPIRVKDGIVYGVTKINFNKATPFEGTDIVEPNYTVIGQLVDCGGEEPLRILERVEVAIAAQAPQGYVTETCFIGAKKDGTLVEVQPYKMNKIIWKK